MYRKRATNRFQAYNTPEIPGTQAPTTHMGAEGFHGLDNLIRRARTLLRTHGDNSQIVAEKMIDEIAQMSAVVLLDPATRQRVMHAIMSASGPESKT
jgi:hypothetical protein